MSCRYTCMTLCFSEKRHQKPYTRTICIRISGEHLIAWLRHNTIIVSGSSKIQTLLLIVENEKMGVLVN
jgi:hypothetical protein